MIKTQWWYHYESKLLLLNECMSLAFKWHDKNIQSLALSLFRGCIILRYVGFFQIFSLNYQQMVLYLYQQMRRNYKIKFTEKLKANLSIYLNLTKVQHLKELTSPYIISYLHFLNLNNILALPKLLPLLKLHFDLIRLMFALFFACQIYTHAH